LGQAGLRKILAHLLVLNAGRGGPGGRPGILPHFLLSFDTGHAPHASLANLLLFTKPAPNCPALSRRFGNIFRRAYRFQPDGPGLAGQDAKPAAPALLFVNRRLILLAGADQVDGVEMAALQAILAAAAVVGGDIGGVAAFGVKLLQITIVPVHGDKEFAAVMAALARGIKKHAPVVPADMDQPHLLDLVGQLQGLLQGQRFPGTPGDHIICPPAELQALPLRRLIGISASFADSTAPGTAGTGHHRNLLLSLENLMEVFPGLQVGKVLDGLIGGDHPGHGPGKVLAKTGQKRIHLVGAKVLPELEKAAVLDLVQFLRSLGGIVQLNDIPGKAVIASLHETASRKNHPLDEKLIQVGPNRLHIQTGFLRHLFY